MKNCVCIWPFDAAPKELQELSGHGGDEDWLVLVPKGVFDVGSAYHNWLDILLELNAFGCCGTSEHKLEDGSVVYIGAHA
jgi:hypothetical protein